MNDIIYEQILVHYIPHIYRPILQKKDLWLLAIQRIQFDSSYASLMTDIMLHTGQPCDMRYCTCKYFFRKDKWYYCKLLNEYCELCL